MKRLNWIWLILFFAALGFAYSAIAHSQTVDSSVHVNQFPGTTVGAKIANAMVTCAQAPVPCILVLDPSLHSTPPGTFPSLCGNCYLVDWRNGPPLPPGGSFPQICSDTTHDPIAQACETPENFAPRPGSQIEFIAGAENSTQGLTLNVNGMGAKPIAIPGDSTWVSSTGGSGWTTILPYDWFPKTSVILVYDGTNWDATGVGINPGGYTPGFEITMAISQPVLQLTGGSANCNGIPTIVAASGTLTMTPDSTNYIQLNVNAGCAIAVNTSGFGCNIPLYRVTVTLGVQTFQDVRSMYTNGPACDATGQSAVVTAPPFNAKCDGSSDDSAALQAAFNSGIPNIYLPSSANGDLQQCNFATTLTVPTGSSLKIWGNQSELDYTGTATALNFLGPNWIVISDAILALTGTGTPVGIIDDGGGESGLELYDLELSDSDSTTPDLEIENGVTFIGNTGGGTGEFLSLSAFVFMTNWGADHFVLENSQAWLTAAECAGEPAICLDLTNNTIPVYITGFLTDGPPASGHTAIACGTGAYVFGSIEWNGSGGGTLYTGTCAGSLNALDESTNTTKNYATPAAVTF